MTDTATTICVLQLLQRYWDVTILSDEEAIQLYTNPLLLEKPVPEAKRWVMLTTTFVYLGPYQVANPHDMEGFLQFLFRVQVLKHIWCDTLIPNVEVVHDSAKDYYYCRRPHLATVPSYLWHGPEFTIRNIFQPTMDTQIVIVSLETLGVTTVFERLQKDDQFHLSIDQIVAILQNLISRYVLGTKFSNLSKFYVNSVGQIAAVDYGGNREDYSDQFATSLLTHTSSNNIEREEFHRQKIIVGSWLSQNHGDNNKLSRGMTERYTKMYSTLREVLTISEEYGKAFASIRLTNDILEKRLEKMDEFIRASSISIFK